MVRTHWGFPAVAALLSCCDAGWAASPANTPAPYQYGQHSYYPAGENLYSPQPAGEVFRRPTFVEPEFLPPEAWQEAPQPGGVQPTQYPFEDSAARDFDPQGHGPNTAIGHPPQIVAPEQHGWLWKESAITATVIPGLNDQFGWTTFDLRATGYFQQAPMLQFLPRFSWHLLEGPTTTDLPPRLYDFALDTLLYLPVERWAFLGMIGPSMFSDLESTDDAFRITGRALAFYQWSPAVKLSGGFLYLDRDDVRALPAGGVIYTPHDDFKAEILFPKPKIAWRTQHDEEQSRWVYVAGEFGGNSWAIRRSSGANDVVSIRDLRLIAGMESIHTEGFHWLLEAGLVFARKLEYRSGIGDTDQDPSGLMRLGIVY